MARATDLGRDRMFPLVCRLAIPTMLAQMVNVLYSIVDRMYIGHIADIGGLALAGVGVCGPIVTLLSSFASLVGLGGAPILAMRLGEGRRDEAEKVVSNGFMTLLALAAVLTSVFLLFKGQLLMWFGASEDTFGYADTYLTIYTSGTVFALLAAGLNSYLIAQGCSGLGMLTVMLGAVMNIALDPVFIFLLHMDVAGAAVATVISQMASCGVVLYCLLRKKAAVRLTRGRFEPALVRRILAYGLPTFIILGSDSAILIILNGVLQRYGGPGEGDMLVTCATIVQSWFSLISLPMGGITEGAQPVVSFNYGAAQPARIKKAILCIALLCLAFCTLMTIAAHTGVSALFVGLFTDDVETAARSVRYIQMFTLMIIPLALQYTFVDELTAMGQVHISLVCSLFRKSLFLASMLLLPRLVSAEATFYCEPIADAAAVIVTGIVFALCLPKILRRRTAEAK